jgi:hypothetical protein
MPGAVLLAVKKLQPSTAGLDEGGFDGCDHPTERPKNGPVFCQTIPALLQARPCEFLSDNPRAEVAASYESSDARSSL